MAAVCGKGSNGVYDVGYAGYDLFDLGKFDQKGSVSTKYGTRQVCVAVAAEVGKLVLCSAAVGSELCDHLRMHKHMKRHLRFFINLWPPFLGAGIRVTRLDADWRAINVEMRLRWWNRNYVGSHYGGSLFSMTDPFYMLMLIENLGRDYIVWDKSSCIRFRRPAKGTVTAKFHVSDAQLDEIRAALWAVHKIEPTFSVEICDTEGTVIAEVQKVLSIRRK